MFAKIKGGRTDQITDIFDEKDVELVAARFMFEQMKAFVDLAGIEMTGTASGQLDDRHSFGPDSLGVSIGLNIAFYNPDSDASFQSFDGFFQQSCLARPRAGDQVDGHDPLGIKVGSIAGSQGVICGKQVFMDFNNLGVMGMLMVVVVVVGMGVGKITSAGVTHEGTFF